MVPSGAQEAGTQFELIGVQSGRGVVRNPIEVLRKQRRCNGASGRNHGRVRMHSDGLLLFRNCIWNSPGDPYTRNDASESRQRVWADEGHVRDHTSGSMSRSVHRRGLP